MRAAAVRLGAERSRIGAAIGAGMLATIAVLVWLPAAANADVGGGDGDGGYTASVSVHFYGTGVKGGSVTHDVTVSPSCYWAPAAGNYTDAVAMLAWYDGVTGGSQTNGMIALYGPRQIWQDQADAEKAHTGDISWYKAYCKDPADYTKFGIGGLDVSDPVAGGPATYVTFLYRPFNAGEAIPAPRVDPEELAKAAYAEMDIPKPEVNRNPMIVGTAGNPTLVGLPTWFWVRQPLAIGGEANELQVTAEVNQPDGRVYATVTAKTGGLTISSDYGSQQCEGTRALVEYAPGRSESQACTVQFSHASKGLPVTMTTHWEATWEGSGNTGGGLDPLNQDATDNVAIAEVQNIVTR